MKKDSALGTFIATILLAIAIVVLSMLFEHFFDSSDMENLIVLDEKAENQEAENFVRDLGDLQSTQEQKEDQTNLEITSPEEEKVIVNTDGFVPPLDQSWERITKKRFGTFVTPQNSPVTPERFIGYHTAIDLEVSPEELREEVSVLAVCNGKLLSKRTVSGYGGVAVQRCLLNDSPITVVYGHLKISSIKNAIGAPLVAGETIGILGADKSVETSGERKHLHLGFHLGEKINVLGYVQSKADLSGWVDPCQYVCKK